MTKRELIEALAPFPDDTTIIRDDTDWGGIDIRRVELAMFHRPYTTDTTKWSECWDKLICYCQDEDDPLEQRQCVILE